MPRNDQGVSHERYKIIPRTLIFIFHNDKVLLIKGAATKRLWANLYNGIGGHIERGEDTFSAAKREVEEETGLKAVDLYLCGSVVIDVEEFTGVGIYVFIGETPSDYTVSSHEGNLEWVTYEKALTLPLVEDLQFLLPKIFQFRRYNRLFHARYTYDEADRLSVVFVDEGVGGRYSKNTNNVLP
jgi:8-oxo-dGTP diphosphatase